MNARGLIVMGLATVGLFGGWSFSSGPVAFAGPPEAPVTEAATSITGTTAILHGELNPTTEATDGYEFTYNTNGTCAEGSTTESGAEAKGKAIKVSMEVAGLVPNSEYTFCIVAIHTPEGEPTEFASGLPVMFKTLSVKPTVENEAGSSFAQTEATVEAQINPNNQPTTCKFEYGTSEALGTSTPCEPAILEGFPGQHARANLTGLSPNTVYYYRAAAENGTGKAEGVPISETRTAPPPPTATTGGPSSVTATSATISGMVNPGSSGPNSDAFYFLEYSAAVLTSEVFQCQEPTCVFVPSFFPGGDAGQGTGDLPEAASLTGLRPLTTYHYWIVAYNGSFFGAFFGGGAAFGLEREFTTLPQAPAVITDPPISVTPTSATIAGEVVPQCVEGRYPPTTFRFEYGTTSAYGAASEEATVAASSCAAGGEDVTTSLAGLQPDTIYHYRLDATNSAGEIQGKDATFTTNAADEAGTGPLSPGFSLTGTAPAGPAVFLYQNLAGLSPLRPPKAAAIPKVLTNAQKLARALKACKAKWRKRRSDCELLARKTHRSMGKNESRGKQPK
jgi:hypothetical protein